MFSKKYRVLIKVLGQEKSYTAKTTKSQISKQTLHTLMFEQNDTDTMLLHSEEFKSSQRPRRPINGFQIKSMFKY